MTKEEIKKHLDEIGEISPHENRINDEICYWKGLLSIDDNLPLGEGEKPHEKEDYRKMLSKKVALLEEELEALKQRGKK